MHSIVRTNKNQGELSLEAMKVIPGTHKNSSVERSIKFTITDWDGFILILVIFFLLEKQTKFQNGVQSVPKYLTLLEDKDY